MIIFIRPTIAVKMYQDILDRDVKNSNPTDLDCCYISSLQEYYVYYQGVWTEYPELPNYIDKAEHLYKSLSFYQKLKYYIKNL